MVWLNQLILGTIAGVLVVIALTVTLKLILLAKVLFFLGEKMLAPHPATLLWRAKVHLYWALAGFGRTAKKNIPY